MECDVKLHSRINVIENTGVEVDRPSRERAQLRLGIEAWREFSSIPGARTAQAGTVRERKVVRRCGGIVESNWDGVSELCCKVPPFDCSLQLRTHFLSAWRAPVTVKAVPNNDSLCWPTPPVPECRRHA